MEINLLPKKKLIKNFNPETQLEKHLLKNYNIPLFFSFQSPYYFYNDYGIIKNVSTHFYFESILPKFDVFYNLYDFYYYIPFYEKNIELDFNNFESFSYLKNSAFISFFVNNFIDVPVCFKKSKSLKSKNFELPLFKFINLLTKQGKKEKTSRIFIESFFNFHLIFQNEWLKSTLIYNWSNYYFICNTVYSNIIKNNYNYMNLKSSLDLSWNNSVSEDGRDIKELLYIKNYIISKFLIVSPIFSYFIYNVDKNIRKFTRGKSGKYVFVWKYIAPYKRLFVTFRWILKDIKFNQHRTFNERLTNTFDNIIKSPEKSFAWKSKIYAYNFVFKNFRKSLMTNLKTIVK